MAQAVERARWRTRGELALPLAFVGIAIAASAAVVALSFSRGEPAEAPAPVAVEDEAPPAGVITYEISGRGLFRAAGDGAPLGTTTLSELHQEGHVAAPADEVISPDGLSSASIARTADGVFLATAIKGGETRILSQLAGPSDPALVAGGKGHARAVEGVPVVVAWSPDSVQIAYGSITGEPYTLTIASALHLASPAMHFVEVAGGYVGEIAWSPDGKRIAISTYSIDRRDHTVLIVEASSGEVRRLIDGCHVTWSPDGEYVAVHRDRGPEAGAWVVSAGNPLERWPITTEEGAFPLTWRGN